MTIECGWRVVYRGIGSGDYPGHMYHCEGRGGVGGVPQLAPPAGTPCADTGDGAVYGEGTCSRGAGWAGVLQGVLPSPARGAELGCLCQGHMYT